MMFLSRVIAVGKHSASARKLAVFSIGTGLAGLASFYGGKEDVAEAKSASLLEWLKEVGVNRSYFEGGKNPLKKIYYGPVLHSLKFGEVTKVEKAATISCLKSTCLVKELKVKLKFCVFKKNLFILKYKSNKECPGPDSNGQPIP